MTPYQTQTQLLERAETILCNMAKENWNRRWWQFWVSRWEISDEPLRGDARNLLIDIARFREMETERKIGMILGRWGSK